MRFNPCPLCAHANPLTAQSCQACGVGMVATCPHCGAVNDTGSLRCLRCDATLPAGEGAVESAVKNAVEGAVAPGSARIATAADASNSAVGDNTSVPIQLRVRFNRDRTLDLEWPDGRGGVVVHTIHPPGEQNRHAEATWIQFDADTSTQGWVTTPQGQAADPAGRKPATAMAMAMAMAVVDHEWRPDVLSPQQSAGRTGRPALWWALCMCLLVMAGGLLIWTPWGAAMLAGPSAAPPATSPPVAGPASTRVEAVREPITTPIVLPAVPPTAVAASSPPPSPALQPAVEAMERLPPSAGRSSAAQSSQPPDRSVRARSAANRTSVPAVGPDSSHQPRSATSVAAVLGTSAPAAPPSPEQSLRITPCIASVAALGLCASSPPPDPGPRKD